MGTASKESRHAEGEQRFSRVRNRSMARKLIAGRAIDISKQPRTRGGYYILDHYVDGKDYCDAKQEAWVWSIGRRKSDNTILASLEGDLYENPKFDCLWLR
jgi:hypothetical protein